MDPRTTPAGRLVVADASAASEQAEAGYLSRLPAPEADALLGALRRLVEAGATSGGR